MKTKGKYNANGNYENNSLYRYKFSMLYKQQRLFLAMIKVKIFKE